MNKIRLSTLFLLLIFLLNGCSSINNEKKIIKQNDITMVEQPGNEITKQITDEKTNETREIKGIKNDSIYQSQGMGNLCDSLSGCFVFCKSNVGRCNNFCHNNPSHSFCTIPNPSKLQPWVKDALTQSLPEGASKVRLILPAPLDKIEITKIGAYGAHRWGHWEGLDHEWIYVGKGTPIGSWADGEVVFARLNNENDPQGGYRVVVYYGDGLWGDHAHVKQPLVKEGDFVKAGDPVAIGEDTTYTNYHFAEFSVADQHRQDGVTYWYKFVKGATLVSPFDYLIEDSKQELIGKWQKEILDKYLSKGEEVSGVISPPWEPYLTNPILIHREHAGELVGEWYLRSSKWGNADIPAILLFFPVNNKYYSKQRVIGGKDTGITKDTGGKDDFGNVFEGDWEADYQNRKVIFYTKQGTYYGIFELNESQPQASLKIEYQQKSYPEIFSDKAYVYKERDVISKGEEIHYWEHPEDDPRNWENK